MPDKLKERIKEAIRNHRKMGHSKEAAIEKTSQIFQQANPDYIEYAANQIYQEGMNKGSNRRTREKRKQGRNKKEPEMMEGSNKSEGIYLPPGERSNPEVYKKMIWNATTSERLEDIRDYIKSVDNTKLSSKEKKELIEKIDNRNIPPGERYTGDENYNGPQGNTSDAEGVTPLGERYTGDENYNGPQGNTSDAEGVTPLGEDYESNEDYLTPGERVSVIDKSAKGVEEIESKLKEKDSMEDRIKFLEKKIQSVEDGSETESWLKDWKRGLENQGGGTGYPTSKQSGDSERIGEGNLDHPGGAVKGFSKERRERIKRRESLGLPNKARKVGGAVKGFGKKGRERIKERTSDGDENLSKRRESLDLPNKARKVGGAVKEFMDEDLGGKGDVKGKCPKCGSKDIAKVDNLKEKDLEKIKYGS